MNETETNDRWAGFSEAELQAIAGALKDSGIMRSNFEWYERCGSLHVEILKRQGNFVMKANRTLLHQLWTKAIGVPGYDKEQWEHLERHLIEFERSVAELTQRNEDQS